jgi:hypothetical protein
MGVLQLRRELVLQRLCFVMAVTTLLWVARASRWWPPADAGRSTRMGFVA